MSSDIWRRIKDSLSERDLNELFAAVENTRNQLAAASNDFPPELKIADPILKIAQNVPRTLEEFRTIPIVGKYADQYGNAFITTINQFISLKRPDNDPMEIELPAPVAQPITVAPLKNTQETEVIRRAKEMGFTLQIIEEGLKQVKDTGIPLSNFEMIVDILFNVQHAKQNINRTTNINNNNKPSVPSPRLGPTVMSIGPSKLIAANPKKENKTAPSKQENKVASSKQDSKHNPFIILESEATTTNKNENKEILSELGKEDLDTANECKICFENEINCLLLPCAHFVICFL